MATALSSQFGITITAAESGAAASAGGVTAGAGTTASASATGVGAKLMAAPVVSKVVAGALAISIVAGGVAVGHQASKNKSADPTISVSQEHQEPGDTPAENANTDGSVEHEEIVSVAEADPLGAVYAEYEAMLQAGVTQEGFAPAYYAYVDIDQDGTPELLMADQDGTPDSWTTCEMYTYQNGEIVYCGYNDARYTYFYHVNGSHLLGTNRLGAWYISPSENFRTIGHADFSITYRDGRSESITEEKFDFYNDFSIEATGEIIPGGFVVSGEIVQFQRNTFLKNILAETLDFSKAWASYGERSCGLNMLSMAFDIYGNFDFFIGKRNSGILFCYRGIYIVDANSVHFWIRTDNEKYGISCNFDPVTLQLTQTSDRGFFVDSYPGEIYQLEVDAENDATRIKQLTTADWSHEP